jgi:hypothetical protein
MMRAVSSWRTRTAVTDLAEIVARFVQSGGRPICRVARVETRAVGEMSNTTQWWNTPEGASGSSTRRTRLRVSWGTPDHDNGGEMSAPSQVYCTGISPPGGIAGLASIRGMALSRLPKSHSPDRDRKRAVHEERVMSEKRLRSGLLVFPDLTPA